MDLLKAVLLLMTLYVAVVKDTRSAPVTDRTLGEHETIKTTPAVSTTPSDETIKTTPAGSTTPIDEARTMKSKMSPGLVMLSVLGGLAVAGLAAWGAVTAYAKYKTMSYVMPSCQSEVEMGVRNSVTRSSNSTTGTNRSLLGAYD